MIGNLLLLATLLLHKQLVTMAIVISLQAVGNILVPTLLITPAATARGARDKARSQI